MASRVTYQNICPEVTQKLWRVMPPDAEHILPYIHRLLDPCCRQALTGLSQALTGLSQALTGLSQAFDWTLSSFDWTHSSFDWTLSSFGWTLSSFDWTLSSFDWTLSNFDWTLSSFGMPRHLPALIGEWWFVVLNLINVFHFFLFLLISPFTYWHNSTTVQQYQSPRWWHSWLEYSPRKRKVFESLRQN